MIERANLKFTHAFAAALVAILLLAAPAAQAMKLKKQNLTQLITESQSIVSGVVKSVTDGIDAKGLPYTEITLAVGQSAKGRIAEGKDYSFRQFGLLEPRKMANGKTFLAVSPEGFPRWNVGESVVAFMYKPAANTGLQTTAGMAQGKFSLANGKVFNAYDNAGLFSDVEIASHLLSEEESHMLSSAGAVDAGTFMQLVGRAISENWIANGEMK